MNILRVKAVSMAALLAGTLAACHGSETAPSAPVSQSAAQILDSAQQADGKIAIVVKDVQADSYDSGVPGQCTVTWNAYNNTKYHLNNASISIAGQHIDVPDLSSSSKFHEDQTFTMDPIERSCVGVVDKLVANGSAAGTTDCSLQDNNEGDCQAKVTAFIALDGNTRSGVAQAEKTAADQYAQDQAKSFEQDKAQAWADRGQLQLSRGAVLIPAPGQTSTMNAVLAPDFDPSKVAPNDEIATSAVPLSCQDPTVAEGGGAPPTLKVVGAHEDRYGLADWYQVQLDCTDEASRTLWVRGAEMDGLLKNQAVQKQG